MSAPYPPGPKGIPFLGCLLEFLRDMPDFLLRTKEQYGDISGWSMGPRRGVLLGDPAWVQQILVQDAQKFQKSHALQRMQSTLGRGLLTSEGDYHLRQRRISSKAFVKSRVAFYADCMVGLTEELAGELGDGDQVNVSDFLMELTLRIAAKTLFDKDTTHEAAIVSHALTELQKLFPFLLIPFSKQLENLPLPNVKRFRRAKGELDQVIYGIIEERKVDTADRGDLLSMLMQSVDDEGNGQGMTDEQLRDECLTIFLAGHETTANALSWTLYLLAKNPVYYERLLAEVDRVLGGRAACAKDFPDLVYTYQVVAESMRLYPPAWTLGRTPWEEYELGPYRVSPGTVVFLSPYVFHRDNRWFPQPLVFDPGRFEAKQVENRPKHSYIPFGAGVRKCIGERFAWMEAVLILATLSQKWRFYYDSGRAMKGWAAVTLRPSGGLAMRAAKR